MSIEDHPNYVAAKMAFGEKFEKARASIEANYELTHHDNVEVVAAWFSAGKITQDEQGLLVRYSSTMNTGMDDEDVQGRHTRHKVMAYEAGANPKGYVTMARDYFKDKR